MTGEERASPTLDEAWKEAEDALPDGWALSMSKHQATGWYHAGAQADWDHGLDNISHWDTESPALALLGLAALLRDRP